MLSSTLINFCYIFIIRGWLDFFGKVCYNKSEYFFVLREV